MKKTISILVAAILLLTMSLGVAAAEEKSSELTLNYDPAPPPATYYITIPTEIALTEAGAVVPIEASDVINLGDQRIMVYVAGAETRIGPDGSNDDYFHLISQENEGGRIVYDIDTANGDTLVGYANYDMEYFYLTPAERELASFTADETKNFSILPKFTGDETSGVYKSSITYGITLVAL